MSDPRSHSQNTSHEAPAFSRDPDLPSYEAELQQENRRNRMSSAIARAPGRFSGWFRGMPERTDRKTSAGRLSRIDGISEDLEYYVNGERPPVLTGDTNRDAPRNKERSDTTTMIAKSIAYALKSAGATTVYSETDGRHHLEREIYFGKRKPAPEVAPDQSNMTFGQRQVNRFRGDNKFSNERTESRVWHTLDGVLRHLHEGVDMDKWGTLVHPDAVKELRDVIIRKAAEKGGERQATLANIVGGGMVHVTDSPAIFRSYFDVSDEAYVSTRNKSDLIPAEVYRCIDILLKLPDAQLDLLGEVAGPVPATGPNQRNPRTTKTLEQKVDELEAHWEEKYQKVGTYSRPERQASDTPSERDHITALRRRDMDLKAREQDVREREIAQRERILAMRQEALDRGELIDAPTLTSKSERQTSIEPDRATQDYEKRKKTWDKQTAVIDRYKQQDKFADLFDDSKLQTLDAAIQAEAAPQFDAAVRRRLEELNQTLPDDEKWKSIDEMTPQEKEKAGRKVLSGQERGDIVNPIDNRHTETYLGDNADNRELLLALSWYRRRIMGRSREPRPPQKKPSTE